MECQFILQELFLLLFIEIDDHGVIYDGQKQGEQGELDEQEIRQKQQIYEDVFVIQSKVFEGIRFYQCIQNLVYGERVGHWRGRISGDQQGHALKEKQGNHIYQEHIFNGIYYLAERIQDFGE